MNQRYGGSTSTEVHLRPRPRPRRFPSTGRTTPATAPVDPCRPPLQYGRVPRSMLGGCTAAIGLGGSSWPAASGCRSASAAGGRFASAPSSPAARRGIHRRRPGGACNRTDYLHLTPAAAVEAALHRGASFPDMELNLLNSLATAAAATPIDGHNPSGRYAVAADASSKRRGRR